MGVPMRMMSNGKPFSDKEKGDEKIFITKNEGNNYNILYMIINPNIYRKVTERSLGEDSQVGITNTSRLER
jgi:hypothetical protein